MVIWHIATILRFFCFENKDTLSGFALFARPSVKTMLGKSIAQQKRFNRTATELNDSPSNILDTVFLQNINDVTQTALEKISFIFPDWESYLVENPQSLPTVTLPSSDTRTDLGTYSIPEVPEENHDFKIQPLLSEMLSKNGDDEAIRTDTEFTFFNQTEFLQQFTVYNLNDPLHIAAIALIVDVKLKEQENLHDQFMKLVEQEKKKRH